MQGILNPGTFVKLNPGNVSQGGVLLLVRGGDKKELEQYIKSAGIDVNSFGYIKSYDADIEEYTIRWLNINEKLVKTILYSCYIKYFKSVNESDVPLQVTFMLRQSSVPAGGVLKQQELPVLPSAAEINPFSFGAVNETSAVVPTGTIFWIFKDGIVNA